MVDAILNDHVEVGRVLVGDERLRREEWRRVVMGLVEQVGQDGGTKKVLQFFGKFEKFEKNLRA